MPKLPCTLDAQVQNVLSAAKAHCGSIAGFYIHGSVCLGGYVEGQSDLDILIITDAPMDRPARIAFADDLLKLHLQPCPVELSVLTRSGVLQQPPVCTFHFSSMWAPRYAAHDETNPLLSADFPDEDIPSYLKLIRQSGIRVFGQEASSLLPEVSDETFWRSISGEIEDYDLHAYGLFCSNILTLPRILSFARTRRILTKAQGAQWGMRNFPQYADLLTRAVDGYANGTSAAFSQDELDGFRDVMIAEIQKGLD